MMKTQRWLQGSIAAVLATSTISGCGIWPFNKVFNGTLEGGSTVANTSLGITYTIPKGFYQDKYEATTIKSVSLWKEGSYNPGERPVISMGLVNWPGIADSNAPPAEDAERLALVWSHDDNSVTHIRRNSWDGPNLPGGDFSADWVLNGKPESCAVAVVGYPGHRVQIEAGNGRPVYLPEVHDVALSAKAIPSK